MNISWLGEAGVRIQVKDTVILIDPPSAETELKPTRQSASIVALTQTDGRDVRSVGGEPFVINTPGEYERQGIFVYGLRLATDPQRVHFRIEAEDMSLGHLGNLDSKLDNGELAQLEGVDILFIPVGGGPVLDADAAAALISQIEPRIVIPIQYKVSGGTAKYSDAAAFLKELGAKNIEPQMKYKIIKRDLPAEETQVVVLARE
ncbi:MAG: MBL fold metallo-hydrolase [Candidatus Kerfeldbacteria bacterium]|nr:MBL fold metallo-hydrolase [Candidatus Kerfeldbacteria bacterium]